MKKNWGFWVFLLIMFAPTFWSLIPGVVFLAVFYAVIKSKNNKQTRKYNRSTTKPKSRVETKRVRFSVNEEGLVNDKLKAYFKENEKLPITDIIFLKTEKGEYTSSKDLYITMGEDCVATLEQFGRNYPKMYNDIMNMLLKFAQSEKVVKEEVIQPEIKKEKKSDTQSYIDRINQLNNEIENEQITNGLYQTCALLKHVSILEKKFPEDKDKLVKLKNYYLPILMDILENYKELNGVGVGDNTEFKKAEERLIKTIILINEAIKSITSSMHEDDFMNLSADMSTLEALLKKDGLVKEGTLNAVKKQGGGMNG